MKSVPVWCLDSDLCVSHVSLVVVAFESVLLSITVETNVSEQGAWAGRVAKTIRKQRQRRARPSLHRFAGGLRKGKLFQCFVSFERFDPGPRCKRGG